MRRPSLKCLSFSADSNHGTGSHCRILSYSIPDLSAYFMACQCLELQNPGSSYIIQDFYLRYATRYRCPWSTDASPSHLCLLEIWSGHIVPASLLLLEYMISWRLASCQHACHSVTSMLALCHDCSADLISLLALIDVSYFRSYHRPPRITSRQSMLFYH